LMGIKRTEGSHPFKENLTVNAELLALNIQKPWLERRAQGDAIFRGQTLWTSVGGWLPAVRFIPPTKVHRAWPLTSAVALRPSNGISWEPNA